MLQGTFDFNNPVRHITAKAELLCDSSAPATKSGSNYVLLNEICETPHNVEIQLSGENVNGLEVKGYGRNLLPFPYYQQSKTENGITFTVNDDGSLHYEGTATANVQFHFTNTSIITADVKAGETYTFSINADKKTSSYSAILNWNYVDIDGNYKGWGVGTNDMYWKNTDGSDYRQTATFPSDACGRIQVYLHIPSGAVVNNTVRPQIELGSTYHPYEPYKTTPPATTDENGKAVLKSISPNMTIIARGAEITANYQVSIEGDNHIFTHDGDLVSIKVDRLGESKFFGFGVGQKANIKVIDRERTCAPTTSNYAVIYFNDVRTLPNMYVSEVHRDENTNEVSITLYDRLYDAAAHTVSELNLTSYTIGEFAAACAMLLGVRISLPALPEFELSYAEGANFEGTETLREALNDVAEATQTIYYINTNNELVFKRLDKDGVPAYTIDKSQYITLDSKTNRRLTSIVSATELGDNVEATTGLTGTTQYVRDNAFWDLHEDRTALVENALAALANFTINQFDCSWRGNYLLEPGDKLALIAKDDSEVHSFLLDDSITYNGAFKQRTQWIYEDEDEEHTNPTSLGDMLKQTFAKVDKANKQIELVVSEVDELSRITMDTGEIEAMVGRIETTTNDALTSINDELIEINNKVNASITAEEVEILVSEKVSSGVNSVETSTGFTFNETGLTVSKSESEISTTITEDGMTINKKGDEVLTANNQGVKAKDLHATTYLIIGNNSRFEDIGSTRTACYWIGG